MKRIAVWIWILAIALGCVGVFSGCGESQKTGAKYEIVAEYKPESGSLTGTVKVTFENCEESAFSTLKFQMYPNAYRKNALYRPVSSAFEKSAYYAGESYGEMTVYSVNGAKNWEVMGEDENILYVFLERELYPGDKVVLDIAFSTKLANVNHRTGITKKTVNLGNAFPILCGIKNGGFYESTYYSDGDPFYSDCADYKVSLTLPKEYVVAATGETVGERTLESKKVYTMSILNARDFAMVVSDRFKVLETAVNGKSVKYYYYDDKNAEESLSAAAESFAFFEKTFGEYPYEQYSVAQTGFCYGGMEYPCLSMISDALNEEAKIRSIVHETAHQWWYAAVGSDQIENAWQDEGVAEYSSVLFFEAYEKYGFTREALVTEALKEYRSYYDVYGSVLGRTDTRMTRNLSEYLSDYEYRCIAYDKGVVMMDTLRKSIGDKKFFSGLKKYYEGNLFRMATPNDLIGSFERAGVDVHGYFESFLSGKTIL
ncbi:MAG: M1 family metallopeptidase [Clostridia bacterium]|nr:M1 family metallopeptidase [Clostridia bacterium]